MSTPFEQLLYQHLIADAAVLAAVGRDGAGNPTIYDDQPPPGVVDGYYPYIRFQRITTNRLYVHSPAAGTANGSNSWIRMQFDIVAKGASSRAQCDSVTRILIASLGTFTNGAPNTSGAPNFVLNERGSTQPQVEGVPRVESIDVRMWNGDQ